MVIGVTNKQDTHIDNFDRKYLLLSSVEHLKRRTKTFYELPQAKATVSFQ